MSPPLKGARREVSGRSGESAHGPRLERQRARARARHLRVLIGFELESRLAGSRFPRLLCDPLRWLVLLRRR